MPGCKAIHYYLSQSAAVKQGTLPLISPTTIHHILRRHGRIVEKKPVEHQPLTRAAPLTHWAMDFKDVTTVNDVDTDKRMHQVETLNIIDSGTSILLDNPVRTDFNAETVIISLTETFRRYGLPQKLTFDRDPRYVGASANQDFPSALVRFLHCLAIEPDICPPQQPFKNPFVERFNRTYKEEGILVYLPRSVAQTIEMNQHLRHHYNYQRPNQALTCGNFPPRVAFATLPTLPPLPETVDPDRWVDSLDGRVFSRRVNAGGSIQLGQHPYYIGRRYRRQRVNLEIVAAARVVIASIEEQEIKQLPLKGLHRRTMPFEAYLAQIRQEAVSEWRRYQWKRQRRLPLVT